MWNVKKVLFEKLKRKFEMNIGIYYIRLLKDKMVYKVCNGIEIKIKGYGGFLLFCFLVVLYNIFWYLFWIFFLVFWIVFFLCFICIII